MLNHAIHETRQETRQLDTKQDRYSDRRKIQKKNGQSRFFFLLLETLSNSCYFALTR